MYSRLTGVALFFFFRSNRIGFSASFARGHRPFLIVSVEYFRLLLCFITRFSVIFAYFLYEKESFDGSNVSFFLIFLVFMELQTADGKKFKT